MDGSRRLVGMRFENVELAGKIRAVLEGDENILLGYLFGSHTVGYVTPLSDVDVAVLLRDCSLRNLLLHRYMSIGSDRLYDEAGMLATTAGSFIEILKDLIEKGC